MLDKKGFLALFPTEDKNIIASLYEDLELAKKINYPVYNEVFSPPHIWNKLNEMRGSLGVETYSLGLNKTSEKRILMFNPIGEEIFSYDFPVVYFKITGGSKFKDLEHRHFLASIMSLGIKREKLGDLIVENNTCYGIIHEDLFDFLKSNLLSISKINVSFEVIDKSEVPESKFLEETHLISSLRLDNLVASITNKSRSSSSELIESGLVTLNYKVIRKKYFSINSTDIISVKRYGKYIFNETLGESKKGKIRILLKKYI